MLFTAACFEAKTTASCFLYLSSLCANQGDDIENMTKQLIHVLSPGTLDLEIVHHVFILFPLRVLHNSASLSSVRKQLHGVKNLVIYQPMKVHSKLSQG